MIFYSVLIDIQKAFDSINWKFLKYVFNLFGFPDVFTSWFNVFYTDRIAYIENNRSRSPPIKIERGNFQGCPLSPLFFILAIEILAIRIRNNPEIVGIDCNNIVKKLNLVADDLLLAFKNSFSGCEQVEQELKEFSLNSGLNINKEKCTVTHLSPSLLPPDPDVLPLFKRNQDQFSYVGFNFLFSKKNFGMLMFQIKSQHYCLMRQEHVILWTLPHWVKLLPLNLCSFQLFRISRKNYPCQVHPKSQNSNLILIKLYRMVRNLK